MNIFDLFERAVQRYRDGYATEPDLSETEDLTVVLGLLGEIIEGCGDTAASMFDEGARRLGDDGGPPFDIDNFKLAFGSDEHLALADTLNRLHGAIQDLQRDIAELRRRP